MRGQRPSWGISIHALLAESDACLPACVVGAPISIHALLAESDTRVLDGSKSAIEISLHALLAESDLGSFPQRWAPRYFYPRSPCGERRACPVFPLSDPANFYPRSPCGERLFAHRLFFVLPRNFYPRSPCGERHTGGNDNGNAKEFLSTLSLRRATVIAPMWGHGFTISIHALLAESDQNQHSANTDPYIFLSTLSLRRATKEPKMTIATLENFYPRSPCGERQPPQKVQRGQPIFLSTLSLRRATPQTDPRMAAKEFLSTLSLRRATLMA